MNASWYILHILPPKKEEEGDQPLEEPEKISPETAENFDANEEVKKDEEAKRLILPQVGTKICHFLGVDENPTERNKENPLWEKIQDEARPAWAPDLLRLGFAVVFKREGIPKMAVKLGIRNPMNVTVQERRRNRILTFDDVLVLGCVPHMRPFYFPDHDLNTEDWWLSTKESKSITAPYLAPKGCTVATGAKRMADVVIEMLRDPASFPRDDPTRNIGDSDGLNEFLTNPLVPIQPKAPSGYTQLQRTKYGSGERQGYGWAGLELYRYGY